MNETGWLASSRNRVGPLCSPLRSPCRRGVVDLSAPRLPSPVQLSLGPTLYLPPAVPRLLPDPEAMEGMDGLLGSLSRQLLPLLLFLGAALLSPPSFFFVILFLTDPRPFFMPLMVGRRGAPGRSEKLSERGGGKGPRRQAAQHSPSSWTALRRLHSDALTAVASGRVVDLVRSLAVLSARHGIESRVQDGRLRWLIVLACDAGAGHRR